MKKLFKTLAAFAVVAALGFGFVSCGDSGDDNNGNSGNNNTNPAQTETALAVFTCDSGYDKRTLTFNEDSTFKVIVSDETGSQAEGTYTFDSGDWENGTITLTATSGYKQDTFTGTKTISEKKITFSSKTYTLTGGTLKIPSDSTASETKKDDTTKSADESGDSGNSGTTKTDTPTTATVSATFKGKVSGFEAEQIFYSDGTYLSKIAGADKYKGTYKLTGTWDSGSVILNQTNEFKDGKWVEAKETENAQIVNGKVDLGDGDSLTKVAATDSSTSTGNSESGNNENKEKPETKVTNDAAAFAGTKGGDKIFVKFTDGEYVQWKNGKEENKGWYKLTGDFTNGTVKMTHYYTWRNTGWSKDYNRYAEPINLTITNGTIEDRLYGSYNTVSYDYDVSQDVPTYTVTIETRASNGKKANCTVTASTTSAHEGTEVTLTIAPDDGYKLDSISAKYNINHTNYDIKLDGTGTIRKFSMPAENVTVTADFKWIYIGEKLPTAAKNIGDIVFSDGSASPGYDITSAKKAAAVAVIFYVGTGEAKVGSNENILGNKTLGIGINPSMKDEYCSWSYNLAKTSPDIRLAYSDMPPEEGTLYYKYNNKYVTGDFDGSDNWTKIREKYSEGEHVSSYHAFEWANNYAKTNSLTGDYASGWYLPSAVELFFIIDNMETLNASIEKIGGTKIWSGENYWSSNISSLEGSWSVGLSRNESSFKSVSRQDELRVCAIRAF